MPDRKSTEPNALPPKYYYKTNQMGLVSFLKLEGHTPQSIRWEEDDTCYWYFDKSDSLLGLVDQFLGGESKVEPREFNRIFGLTRKELMGSQGRSSRSGRTAATG